MRVLHSVGLWHLRSIAVYGLVLLSQRIHVECKHVVAIECVRVTDCPVYDRILRTRSLTPAHIEHLRESRCGFDKHIEKVWCPQIVASDSSNNSNITTPKSRAPSVSTKLNQTHFESRDGANTNASTSEKPRNLFPDNAECGSDIFNKIIGGNSTNIDEYPWMALLAYRENGELVPRCGGVLINRRYVLTAAHCVNSKLHSAILGEYDIRNDTDCIFFDTPEEQCAPKPIKLRIEEITKYKKTLRNNYHDDIALLRLEKDVVFTDFVSPICLPPKNMEYPKVGTNVTVIGWGNTEEGYASPVKLQVTVPLVSRSDCSTTQGLNITEKMICAGKEGKDSCNGDSGGPLIYYDVVYGHWNLMGVVSFSLKSCGKAPGVYTWLPPYIDWIHQTVR